MSRPWSHSCNEYAFPRRPSRPSPFVNDDPGQYRIPFLVFAREFVMKKPVTITITGAAGNIGYALAFRVASGQMLGPDQPVNLNLLEIPAASAAVQGVVMELNDCAFATLNKITATSDANEGFKDCNFAMLVGARPRGPGMERKDLRSEEHTSELQ